MTGTGRGDPSATEAVTRGQRQGSVSSRELLGLDRARRSGPWRGVVFLLSLVIIAGVVGLLVLGPALRNMAYETARTNPQVMRLPFVPDVVRERLGADLTTPAGDRPTRTKFTVEGGASVAQVGRSLKDRGLIRDDLAFMYLAVTQGADGKLHTGTFNLDANMTPQQIVTRLQQPPDPPTTKVFIPLRTGLRLEQVTAKLLSIQNQLAFDPRDFYALVTDPPQWVRDEYPWLKALPEGRSLEGFLGAGQITVDSDTTQEALLRVLLDDWARDVGPEAIERAEKAGKDFYEVLTLASIIERETARDEERRKVAGVYQNRLDRGGRLNADPTVSYAVDSDRLAKLAREGKFADWMTYSFWSAVKKQAERKVSAGMKSYQTYLAPGLPDGPIGSPTLASIEAALDPDTGSGYLYFFACQADARKGQQARHQFEKTLAAHRRNVQRCG